jgi:hypothetical protein
MFGPLHPVVKLRQMLSHELEMHQFKIGINERLR